jgi:ABC-type glycerol-3-phosphate transport system substrate-binding protein
MFDSRRAEMQETRNPSWIGHGILALTLAAVVAGCDAPQLAATPPEPVTLRFGYYTNRANYEPLAEQFHELHPHVTVELVTAFWDRGNDPLDILDSAELDAIRWGGGYLEPERLERLLPLDAMVEVSEEFPLDDMVPGTTEALRIDGIQWGIPAGLDLWVAYYDPVWFELTGTAPPPADWTLDDLVVAADGVNGYENLTYGFCSTTERGDIFALTRLLGGQLFGDLQNPTLPTLNTLANVDAIQWYASLRHEYGVVPDPARIRTQFRYNGIEQAIAQGMCGVWLARFGERGGLTWGGGAGGYGRWERERVMLPLPRGQETVTLGWVDGYYVLSQSNHPAEAWEWISFLIEHEAAAGQMIPPRLSHIHSEAYAARVGADALGIARDLPDNLHMVNAVVSADEDMGTISEMYLDVADRALRGRLDGRAAIQGALDDAQTRAEALFIGGQ